jgi:hypothetical protein
LEEIAISEYPNQYIVFLDGSTADLRPLREAEATPAPVVFAGNPAPAPAPAPVAEPVLEEKPTAAAATSAAGVVSSTEIAGLVLASVGVFLL